ncbi:Centrosome and spindle pole-associated protein 1 [Hondaea fermentalgiana]|uniref:Centrosome and spindle pole-associated protein 1 n=1 Tax=Hondaea fermentalgiana TaxID=2315210 RepID=A0A2R5GVF1_9STRA|nr:Centrosome and spindle pole-associated protein 1 [Hondaea fermentalgiana]|eukprot:GBG33748.1 Centrosome and spindle pole-associated protein 1 [Hondaea fermentalgiana]
MFADPRGAVRDLGVGVESEYGGHAKPSRQDLYQQSATAWAPGGAQLASAIMQSEASGNAPSSPTRPLPPRAFAQTLQAKHAPPDEAHLAKLSKQEQFRRELDIQIALKNERKAQEKLELQREQQRERQEIANYNPFGKGGAGAPLRDSHGGLIANLRTQSTLTSPTHHQHDLIAGSAYPTDGAPKGKTSYMQSALASPTRPQEPSTYGFTPYNTAKVSNYTALASGFVPPLDFDNKTSSRHMSPGINSHRESESARHSRFHFDRAAPEEQLRIQEKLRKQHETEQFLREQLEEKRRRLERERREREEEERKEEERLEREREELRMAFEREKGRYTGAKHQDHHETAPVSSMKVADTESTNNNNNNNNNNTSNQQATGNQHLHHQANHQANDGSPQHFRKPRDANPVSPQHSPARHHVQMSMPSNQPREFLPAQGRDVDIATRAHDPYTAGAAPGRDFYYGHAEVGHARLSVLREEILGECDTLRKQIRRQEDALRDLVREVTVDAMLGASLLPDQTGTATFGAGASFSSSSSSFDGLVEENTDELDRLLQDFIL